MNKKIVCFAVLVSLFCLIPFVSAASCNGGGITNPLGDICDFSALLANIIQGVGSLIASLGVIMIIVAGILYLTSAGSPERMGKAKTALIYAIVGIVIGILANVIPGIILKILNP